MDITVTQAIIEKNKTADRLRAVIEKEILALQEVTGLGVDNVSIRLIEDQSLGAVMPRMIAVGRVDIDFKL